MNRLPRPRSGRGWLLAAGGVVVLVAAVFVVAYFVVFPTSSPERFSVGTTAAGPVDGEDLVGGWTVGRGSRVGYRVREKLAFLPAKSDAVGRTGQVTGSATVGEEEGALRITAATFRADVRTLQSDDSRRDQRIEQIGIESARYPTATFALSDPVLVPAAAESGAPVRARATGVLTIHGRARRETIPITLRLGPALIQAVGSLTFPWGEFGMTAPSVAGFVSVTDRATMEFDLRLRPR